MTAIKSIYRTKRPVLYINIFKKTCTDNDIIKEALYLSGTLDARLNDTQFNINRHPFSNNDAMRNIRQN